MQLPEILEEVQGFLSRYIVFSNEAQATAVTLWVAHRRVEEIERLPVTVFPYAVRNSHELRARARSAPNVPFSLP